MNKAWLKNLMQHHRPNSLPDELLQVHGNPVWDGKSLHIMLRKTEGIAATVMRIYPGAEWQGSEDMSPNYVHLKLYADDAHHYAEKYAQRYPNNSLDISPKERPHPLDTNLRALVPYLVSSEPGVHHDGQPFLVLTLVDAARVNTALRNIEALREDDINIINRGPKSAPVGSGFLTVSLRGSLAEAFNAQKQLHQSGANQDGQSGRQSASR